MADGDLDQRDFDIAFAFSRPNAAAYRNAAGALVTAPVDTPRFDFEEGVSLGLLVETGAELGQADRTRFDPLMVPEALLTKRVTVLHALDMGSGLVRRAWYSEDLTATLDALLSIAGHHAHIGVLEGYRKRKGSRFEAGYVRYRGQSWYLTRALSAGPGLVLADDADRPLIGA